MRTISLRLGARLGGAVATVGAFTCAAFYFFNVNSTTAALGYMLLILSIATAWGLWEALTAAVASAGAMAYCFLPPVGFAIADRNDWIALSTFVLCPVLTSELSARIARKTREAVERQQETERLYALSRAFLLIEDAGEAAGKVAQQLAQTFGFNGVALYYATDDAVFHAGLSAVPVTDEQMRSAISDRTGNA